MFFLGVSVPLCDHPLTADRPAPDLRRRPLAEPRPSSHLDVLNTINGLRFMRCRQARRYRRIPLPTVCFVSELMRPDGPQPTLKLLNPIRFPTCGGIFQGARGHFVPAVRD